MSLFKFEKHVPATEEDLSTFDRMMLWVIDNTLASANERYKEFSKKFSADPLYTLSWSQRDLERFALARYCWVIREVYQEEGELAAVSKLKSLKDRLTKNLLQNQLYFNSASLAQNLVNEVTREAASQFIELVEGFFASLEVEPELENWTTA